MPCVNFGGPLECAGPLVRGTHSGGSPGENRALFVAKGPTFDSRSTATNPEELRCLQESTVHFFLQP